MSLSLTHTQTHTHKTAKPINCVQQQNAQCEKCSLTSETPYQIPYFYLRKTSQEISGLSKNRVTNCN